MKEFFDRDYRFAAGLSAKGRKERRFYLIMSVILFIPAAFTLWEVNYELWNMVGSIACASFDQAFVELTRMLPLFLTAAAYVVMLIYTHGAYRAGSERSRRNKWSAGGIAVIILGAVITVYVPVGVAVGKYGKLIEGYISPLFPLDVMLGGVMFIGLGILSVHYSKVLTEKLSELPFVTDRSRIGLRFCKFGLLRCLGLLIVLCSFAGSVRAAWVLDLKHGYVLFGIMLWLNYLIPFVMYLVYRYIFCELKAELRGKASIKFGCFFLAVNLIIFILYNITLQIWNEAPNVTAFGLLPIDFTASMNAFAVIFGANNLLTPVIAIIRGAFYRESENKG